MLAGKLFNIPVRGTHAHAYIDSFRNFAELPSYQLCPKKGNEPFNLLELAIKWRSELVPLFKVIETEASDGELTALISYAIAFPDGFMALVDTYDVKRYPCRMPHAFTLRLVTLPNTLIRNTYR